VAIQAAASSAAHLTKYSNITDLTTGQKKLIVDEAIVPSHPVFDYSVTHSASFDLTADGALDSMAHILEVFYGANGKPYFDQMVRIATAGLPLIIEYLPRVKTDPYNKEAREALGLASDLGGYAIMLGGTNGAHLTSFSLVDILSHGRACALMQPYYTVFFSPVIEPQLELTARFFEQSGHLKEGLAGVKGRGLGEAVARGMFEFARTIGFPTTLGDVPGFGQHHIDRALAAAKNPQLKMKLENMPVPLSAETIDAYMQPILQAAKDGDLKRIENIH
jgi:alcohol dehydrogenase